MNRFNPKIHHRRSIRFKGLFYGRFYFITICGHDKFHRFGKIENESMILNEYGEIASMVNFVYSCRFKEKNIVPAGNLALTNEKSDNSPFYFFLFTFGKTRWIPKDYSFFDHLSPLIASS